MLHEARQSEKVVGSDQTFVANRLNQIAIQSDWRLQELLENYQVAFGDPEKVGQRQKLYTILQNRMSSPAAQKAGSNVKKDLKTIKEKSQLTCSDQR